ncbi:MAG: iron-containing alcohol dehydrogenase, partial [Bacillales bacterium]
MKTFFVKPKIYYGRNSLAFLSTLDVNRVCIVTDKMMVKLGVADKIKSYVTHTVCTIFDEVEPNPSLDTVKKALAIFLDDGPDVMIAVGGGSPIDAAKAILYLSDEISKQIPFKRPLFIAVPTTSGTGSEVTSYSVVTDTERNIKIPFTDERMMPDIAILDEELTKTVPPTVTADTGMDVLTHAIEAFTSAPRTPTASLTDRNVFVGKNVLSDNF